MTNRTNLTPSRTRILVSIGSAANGATLPNRGGLRGYHRRTMGQLLGP